MQKIKIAKGETLGKVKNVAATWANIAKTLTKHKQADTKGGAYFVGGYFKGSTRKDAELVARTLLTIDIDKTALSVDEIQAELELSIDAAWCAYSTFSHGDDNLSSVRVVVPLSQELHGEAYRAFSKAFCSQLDLPVDPCSYKPNQAMYLPVARDLSAAWSYTVAGGTLDVGDVPDVADDDGDLESMLAAQPLDISADDITTYLSFYGADGLNYDAWLEVGAAIHHQTAGSDAGYSVWLDWSALSDKHDPDHMRVKWRSFGKKVAKPVTFATVIHRVKQRGGAVSASGGGNSNAFKSLLSDAESVSTVDDYHEYRQRVSSLPDAILPPDYRAHLCAALAAGYGKSVGITKGDIKKALARPKQGRVDNGDVANLPEWLRDWIFIETTCEFHNLALNYAIKPLAFNAKYDRMSEVQDAECNACQYALVMARIDTVVDSMFFPTAEQIFTISGKKMLNAYVMQGAEPCATLDGDDEALEVVESFLSHVHLIIEDRAEQRILLDWMAHVCQNVGQRVNWALLLQGAQGSGKTYFVKALQYVLGDNVKNLDPTSIAGRFTGWAHGALVNAVEEIRISGTNKYEVLDRMKPFITNDTIMIEEKGRDHRTVPNFTSYLMLTNHQDAIPLSAGDRRYAVIYSRIQSEARLYKELGGVIEAEKYFDRLFELAAKRPDALAFYLKNMPISKDFSPRGRAPHTSARDSMMQLAISPERSAVEDAIEQFACDVISSDVLDVTWLKSLCDGEGTDLPQTRMLSSILLDMGYRQMDGRRIKISKTKRLHYVWHSEKTKSESAKDDVRNYFKND